MLVALLQPALQFGARSLCAAPAPAAALGLALSRGILGAASAPWQQGGPAAAAEQLQQAAPLSAAAATAAEPAFRVSDLIDQHSGPFGSPEQQSSLLRVLRPGLRNYGGRTAFFGRVATIDCSQVPSNKLVHEAVKEAGQGRVLVIDAGASLQASVLGDILAGVAAKHGWQGLVVNGCVRDAATLPGVPIGVKALASSPMRPGKGAPGRRDVPVVVGGVPISPGDWLYSDEDGILVSPHELEMPDAQQLAEVRRSLYGLGGTGAGDAPSTP